VSRWWLLLSWIVPSLGAQQATSQDTANGRRLMVSRRYTEAVKAYTEVLSRLPVQDTGRKMFLFRRALATHQRALSSGDSGRGAIDTSALIDYRAVRSLDSGKYYAAASANAAILLRSVGNHTEAYSLFRDAATVDHPAKAYFLLNEGREAEALGWPDSAERVYQRALAIEPQYPEALRSLLTLCLKRNQVDELIAVAAKLGPRAGDAEVVTNALLAVMERPGTDTTQLARAFLLIAGSDATAGVSPAEFTSHRAAALSAIARRQAWLLAPIEQLTDAYRMRSPAERFNGPSSGSWWRASDDRRHFWSVTLRALGDWYNTAGQPGTAESYYEAALGLPNLWDLYSRWVDLGALVPLATLYARDETPDRGARKLDDFVHYLYAAKGAAYLSNDLARAREFHMALGALYAQRHEWDGSPTGAIFQLEHMRAATRQLGGRLPGGGILRDPPALLELLSAGYRATGNVDSARAVALEARDGYFTIGNRDAAQRMNRLLEALGHQ
jgi:tetratricopeptide (TPR) repeat protein